MQVILALWKILVLKTFGLKVAKRAEKNPFGAV